MAFADLHGILLFALASHVLNHPAMLQRIEPSLIRRFVYTNDLYTVPITQYTTCPHRCEVRLRRQLDCDYLAEKIGAFNPVSLTLLNARPLFRLGLLLCVKEYRSRALGV